MTVPSFPFSCSCLVFSPELTFLSPSCSPFLISFPSQLHLSVIFPLLSCSPPGLPSLGFICPVSYKSPSGNTNRIKPAGLSWINKSRGLKNNVKKSIKYYWSPEKEIQCRVIAGRDLAISFWRQCCATTIFLVVCALKGCLRDRERRSSLHSLSHTHTVLVITSA